ncbi:MAG: Fic family protein [candidate division Zixibacteria bacterium]|nr:Fic family protein [candidate division Zixibacteria bacterium]MDH3937004.1 Fic family protein [candidate division Zixibacteria bacterium]MDH4034279.1 Fic family protein [candidate division Zixibacteria bacterium]
MGTFWYKKYDELSVAVKERKSEYVARCKLLGADPNDVFKEVFQELVARAVKESNWQEGLRLSEGKTQAFATAAFQDQPDIRGLRLDTGRILATHRRNITRLVRDARSEEEIGAYNLSLAYFVLPLIASELQSRQTASLAKALLEAYTALQKSPKMPPEADKAIKKGMQVVEELKASQARAMSPLTENVATQGEQFSHLLSEEFSTLVNPMTAKYLHFLHRITLAGLQPPSVCGRYRKTPVNVGLEDVYFPAPSLVPGLTKEYCEWFPSLLSNVTKYDPLLMAARVSYRFVAIHPYGDGNGRVSRLLMNLVLWSFNHPPVYLKADKKGRHRYGWALRKANRGNLEPLACLIAISLEEIYSKLISTVRS